MRCVRCGSSAAYAGYRVSDRVQTYGSKISYYGYKKFTEYSTNVPVCYKCKKKFKKYDSIKLYSIILFLIEWIIFWIVILTSYNTTFLYIMIPIIAITLCSMIYLRFSGLSPKRYVKFDSKRKIFYVKSKVTSSWVPEHESDSFREMETMKQIPQEAWDYYNSGVMYASRGNFEDGLSKFNNALEIHPEFPNALSGKGEILSNLGKYEEALKCLNDALKYNSNLMVAKKNRDAVLKILNSKETQK